MNDPAVEACSQDPIGSMITTACGGKSERTAETPCATYRGKPVYFCLQTCKREFEHDPQSSCLSLRLDEYGG